MSFNPLVVLLTIIGGLVVAGLVGWIKKPRLVVLVPRTFSYSQITERGQLVEVTVFNRSFKTEEDIDVTLNPQLSYEMLGSNSQDASVTKNRIRISRIGPSDEVTVLLMVENGVFKPDDITQTLSKETKGKTVSKLEEVPPTGSQRIGLVAFLIGVPVFLYAGFLGLESVLQNTPLVQSTDDQRVDRDEKRHEASRAWIIPRYARSASPALYSEFISGKLTATLGTPARRGDIVTVPLRVNNETSRVIKFDLSMTTASSEKRIPSYERRQYDVVVLPGQSEERSIKVVIPEKATNPAERWIFVELSLDDMAGGSLHLKQRHEFR